MKQAYVTESVRRNLRAYAKLSRLFTQLVVFTANNSLYGQANGDTTHGKQFCIKIGLCRVALRRLGVNQLNC